MSAITRCRAGALIGAVLLCAATPAVHAEPELVVDAGTGAVLSATEPHTPWYPASLTKLMTLYLAFDAIAAGELALDEPITVSAGAAGQPEVRLGLRTGSTITTAEAITATAVASANDAAVVLAERLAGSETAFAARMSARARTLGLTGTQFVNATGLPGAGQRTTARDMAILAMRLLQDHPQHAHYFALRQGTYNGGTFTTVNGVLGAIDGADGMKTGFTCDAGYNIVASASRNGRRLLAVVLGGGSGAARNRRAVDLLQQALRAPAPADAPLLASMLPSSIALSAPPQPRLDRDTCARGATREALGPGKLPGHALLVGVFRTEPEARRAVAETLRALRGAVNRARPVYLKRQFERGSSFKALLVGMDRATTGRACLSLRAQGVSCHPQTHEQINHPRYAWH
jgi:D-alanyl-D-alanine carboxypeptidase